jgi:hypothetical protein
MNSEIQEILQSLNDKGYNFVLILDEGNRTGICFSNMPPLRAVSLVTGVTEAMYVETKTPMNN